MSFRTWLLEHLPEHGSFRDKVSQWKCVTDDSGVIVDFIGRFENLDSDWPKIASRIPGAQSRLAMVNKARRSHYHDYHDEETVEYVRANYQDDIEAFDYRFD